MPLFQREIVNSIKSFFDSPDILVLHGARQVGKTSILYLLRQELSQQGNPTFYLDLEDLRFLDLLNAGADNLVKFLREQGLLKKGRLNLFVDEIQYLSDPSRLLKLTHDRYGKELKLFVSGSSSFGIKNKFRDSLVGRTVHFEVFPLSFQEFLLFKNQPMRLDKPIETSQTITELQAFYREYILYGGYPRIVLEDDLLKKETYLQQIIDTYIRKDIRDLANIQDILKFNKLLEVLASQSGQLLNVSELSNTARLARSTIDQYLFLMENTYIIKLVRPFSTNLRSELFKTPKIFFLDSGVAQLLAMKTFSKTIQGSMFETSIFSELTKNRNIKEVFHWRTQDGKEIDFIVRKDRKLFPIEVKLSSHSLKRTALKYFLEKYQLRQGTCITLEKHSAGNEQTNFCYPWELIRMFSHP